MKSEEFRNILTSKYLFHLHTPITDGQITIGEYFNFAKANKVKSIFFTEHVRKELKYDFQAFVDEIKKTQEDFAEIIGYISAEAKVLPGGGLDISSDVFNQLDVLCFACHGFPDDIDLYFNSFETLFKEEQWKSVVRVFVHPGRYLMKRDLMTVENKIRLNNLLHIAVENGVWIEDNRRENLPPDLSNIPTDKQVVGFDIHRHTDLERWKMASDE
jgi:histidinol phosphatase-like PHP family hydrolase